MHLILTFASGKDFLQSEGFASYLRSCQRCFDFSKTKLVICTVQDDEQIWPSTETPYEVFAVEKSKIQNLFFDRHWCFYSVLRDLHSSIDKCLITDCKDVIFQKNPFKFPSSTKINFCSEGMLHEDSQWNMIDQFQAQLGLRQKIQKYTNKPVVNAGVMLGNAEFLKNFEFMMWNACNRTIGSCTDQGVLNNILFELENDKDVCIHHPSNSLFCLTGEHAKMQLDNDINTYKFKNKTFLNLQNKPYYIVHQYNRLPEANSIYRAR